MKSRYVIVACIAIVYAIFIMAAPRQPIVSAEPNAQSTAVPTEEPTKRPYAFPTPIFIPTYADDTPIVKSTPATSTIQPSADTYTVQSGDTLWVISQKVYGDGSKYKLILQANDMTDQSKLRVGSVLKIPSVPGTVPSLAPTSAPDVPPSQVLPSPASVAPVATTAPQATVTPTPVPTSVPPSPSIPFTGETLGIIINLVSLILFVTGIFSGVLAYLRYQRIRRLEELSSTKHPIRVRQ